ncbi:MAG: hypothetical protein IPN34_21070 [Planctomycetes bacterium]|nr:hypothetical protein [Planctomycetota bacterium]
MQLFLEYLRAEPWHDYESDSFFGLSVPGERSPMLASILGGAGEEFGLGLYRGPKVIAEVHEAMRHEVRTPASNRTSLLSALPIPLRDLDARRRTQLRKVGVRTDPGVLFVARDAGELPRVPSEEEEVILEWALKGTLLAHERGLIEVRELRTSGSLSLVRECQTSGVNAVRSVGSSDPSRRLSDDRPERQGPDSRRADRPVALRLQEA